MVTRGREFRSRPAWQRPVPAWPSAVRCRAWRRAHPARWHPAQPGGSASRPHGRAARPRATAAGGVRSLQGRSAPSRPHLRVRSANVPRGVPKSRFSPTLMWGKSRSSWNRRPMRRPSGGRPSRTLPFRRIVPTNRRRFVEVAGDVGQQRRLAAAAGAHQRDDFAGATPRLKDAISGRPCSLRDMRSSSSPTAASRNAWRRGRRAAAAWSAARRRPR